MSSTDVSVPSPNEEQVIAPSVCEFVLKRQQYYQQRMTYYDQIAAVWKNANLDVESNLTQLYYLFNEGEERALVKFEEDLVANKPLTFEQERERPNIDNDKAVNYIKTCSANRSKNAELWSMQCELLYFGWMSLNPQSSEVQKQVDQMIPMDETSLIRFEKRFFHSQERIFSTSLKFADGEGKPTGEGDVFISGPYEIYEKCEGIDFCRISFEFFDFDPNLSFENFLRNPVPTADPGVSSTKTAKDSGTDDATQVESSSDWKLRQRIYEVLSKLNVVNLREYKVEKMKSDSNPPGFENGSSSPISYHSVINSNGSESTPPADTNHLPIPKANSKPSRFQIVEVHDAPRSIDHEENMKEMNAWNAENRQLFDYIPEKITVSTWRALFDRFCLNSVFSNEEKNNATFIATMMQIPLIRLYTRAHEFEIVEYLRSVNSCNLRRIEFYGFLFMIEINTDADIIFYALLNVMMFDKKTEVSEKMRAEATLKSQIMAANSKVDDEDW